jgi:hypothetical protein
VIEKTAVMHKFGREEFQRGDHALTRIRARNEATLLGDTDGGKTETGSSDAAYV